MGGSSILAAAVISALSQLLGQGLETETEAGGVEVEGLEHVFVEVSVEQIKMERKKKRRRTQLTQTDRRLRLVSQVSLAEQILTTGGYVTGD